MDADGTLAVLRETAAAVFAALELFEGEGASGQRAGQYALDLVADRAACDVLLSSGLSVFSEESGAHGDAEVCVVVDPVDGSTNCDRGIPFYSISMCAMDASGPWVSMVENLATRDVYTASRGHGAMKNGRRIAPSGATSSRGALVAVNGVLTAKQAWGQVRALGSAALELCLVADGSLDGLVQVDGATLRPWDYLAGLQIVQEAGGAIRSGDGEELMAIDAVGRRPLAAATQVLADQLLEESKLL